MAKKGILIVLSGFSGAGKGSIVKNYMSSHENCALSVSATTREMREGEVDGESYFFVTKERFLEMIERHELYEYACYQDKYYGTPRAYVDEQLNAGKDVILEIEVQGAEKIKARFPETVLVFVVPPAAEDLIERLRHRGTESEEKIYGRIRRAVEETDYMQSYDYILVNDKLDEAVATLDCIVKAEYAREHRFKNKELQIKKELVKLIDRKGEQTL